MWTRRDGTRMEYADMSRHHAWNAQRMLKRNYHYVPLDIRIIVGEVRGPRLAWYHARNVLYLLTHPHKINRCTLRGI